MQTRAAIHFRQVEDSLPFGATARYLKESLSLIVAPQDQLPSSMDRTSIDTLTFSLRPLDHVLVALDAYTNWERWRRQPLTIPVVSEESLVACTDQFDRHGIAPAADGHLTYFASFDLSILHIRASDEPVVTRTRCLSSIVFGLGAAGELVDVWIEGLRFE